MIEHFVNKHEEIHILCTCEMQCARNTIPVEHVNNSKTFYTTLTTDLVH